MAVSERVLLGKTVDSVYRWTPDNGHPRRRTPHIHLHGWRRKRNGAILESLLAARQRGVDNSQVEQERRAVKERAADALAYECARAVRSGRLDARSGIADALLDYLDIGGCGGPADVGEWMRDYEKKQSPTQPAAEESATLKAELPRIIDYGDGVKGHFCIGKPIKPGSIFGHFWNDECKGGSWCSAGSVYVGRAAAETKLRELVANANVGHEAPV